MEPRIETATVALIPMVMGQAMRTALEESTGALPKEPISGQMTQPNGQIPTVMGTVIMAPSGRPTPTSSRTISQLQTTMIAMDIRIVGLLPTTEATAKGLFSMVVQGCMVPR